MGSAAARFLAHEGHAVTVVEQFAPDHDQGSSFGSSRYCLGAALARMEADECFRILLRRFPNVRPAYEKPDWQVVAPLSHNLKTLQVKF